MLGNIDSKPTSQYVALLNLVFTFVQLFSSSAQGCENTFELNTMMKNTWNSSIMIRISFVFKIAKDSR